MRQIKDWKTIVNEKILILLILVILYTSGVKKLHLNKRGTSILAKNILKNLRDSYWNNDILNCGKKHDECKPKLLSKSINSISFGSIRDACKRNLKGIILGHLNINSTRNKFDLLVDQIKGNVDIMVISETIRLVFP